MARWDLEALTFLSVKYAFSHFSWYLFFKMFSLWLMWVHDKYVCFHNKRFWFFENEIFLPRPKIANVAKQSHVNKTSHMQPLSRVHFRALEALEFSVLKYAFSHILEGLFASHFWHLLQHLKWIKLYLVVESVRYFCAITHFTNLPFLNLNLAKNDALLKMKHKCWKLSNSV